MCLRTNTVSSTRIEHLIVRTLSELGRAVNTVIESRAISRVWEHTGRFRTPELFDAPMNPIIKLHAGTTFSQMCDAIAAVVVSRLVGRVWKETIGLGTVIVYTAVNIDTSLLLAVKLLVDSALTSEQFALNALVVYPIVEPVGEQTVRLRTNKYFVLSDAIPPKAVKYVVDGTLLECCYTFSAVIVFVWLSRVFEHSIWLGTDVSQYTLVAIEISLFGTALHSSPIITALVV